MKAKSEIVIIENNIKRFMEMSSDEALVEAVVAGCHVIEAYAKINAERVFSGHSTQSSGLAGSFVVNVDSSGKHKAEASVGPTVVYGRIQELGGTIKPIFAKLLHWIDRRSGQHIFAKQVTIPPRPYLRPAVDEHKEDILDAITAVLRRG